MKKEIRGEDPLGLNVVSSLSFLFCYPSCLELFDYLTISSGVCSLSRPTHIR